MTDGQTRNAARTNNHLKISIVTAVRNGAAMIGSTIRSVNAQTYPNVEHVFVDGASTDGTADVIRKKSTRTHQLLSEPDRGIYDAFAKGSKLATGDVIVYLNAGDVYAHEGVLAEVAKEFAARDVDAVFGDVAIVDAADQQRVVRRYRSSRFSPAMISYGFMPAHTALFLRREMYERYGSYDSSYRIAGDFELVARIFSKQETSYAYIDAAWVSMPRGGASSNGWESNWVITQEMRRACYENGVSTNYLKLALRFPIKATEWFWRD